MAENHLKKCSVSLAIKEVQIKTTLRLYLPSLKMAEIKWTSDSSCWQGCVKEDHFSMAWGVQTDRATVKIRMAVPQEDGKQRTPRSSYTTVTVDKCPKDTSSYHRHTSSTTATVALVTVA